jgi:formamidopyrimidine-DNA glycosylase
MRRGWLRCWTELEDVALPELPDVAHIRETLESNALEHEIVKTTVPDERILENTSPQGLGRQVKGERFESAAQHGKYLFAEISHGWVVFHFGMTGTLEYYRDDRPRYAKVIFHLDNEHQLAYVCTRLLGLVGVTEDPESYAEEKGLGPNALDPKLALEEFEEAISKRRARIKALLMNQSFVAGIGNVYADEILFQARIHPETRADDLGEERIDELYEVMRDVLSTAVTDPDSLGSSGRGSIIDRRGEDRECPVCGGSLSRIQVSGRTTYYCARCQS